MKTIAWNDILKLPDGALAGERRVPKTQLAEQAKLAKASATSIKLLDKVRDVRFFASLNKSNSRILPVKDDAYGIESVIFLTCGLNSTTGIAEALRMVHGCFPNPTVILAEGFANSGNAVSAALRRKSFAEHGSFVTEKIYSSGPFKAESPEYAPYLERLSFAITSKINELKDAKKSKDATLADTTKLRVEMRKLERQRESVMDEIKEICR